MAFAAKGADPTTLAPFEPFAPKDEVSAEVDTRIATMNGIDPPAELSSIWTKFARYYDAVKQSVATMPDGGHLSDPDLLRDGSLLLDAATEYSSYWSNNCA